VVCTLDFAKLSAGKKLAVRVRVRVRVRMKVRAK
jgi:hypothetical protein